MAMMLLVSDQDAPDSKQDPFQYWLNFQQWVLQFEGSLEALLSSLRVLETTHVRKPAHSLQFSVESC